MKKMKKSKKRLKKVSRAQRTKLRLNKPSLKMIRKRLRKITP